VNRYRFSRQAEQDLEDIWVYLTQQDELLADKQIAQILDRLPMLSQFPDMGKQREDLLVGLRSFLLSHTSSSIPKSRMASKLSELCINQEIFIASFRNSIIRTLGDDQILETDFEKFLQSQTDA